MHLMEQIERQPGGQVAAEDARGSITLDELRTLSNRLANAFIGLGLAPGSRVAYAANNTIEYVVLEFALLKAGLVKVPLNPRMTAADLLGCVELAEVRLVVADTATATTLDEVRDQAAFPIGVVVGARSGWRSWDDLIASGSPARPRVRVDGDDLYHIRFSSGSTGKPKGIAISQSGARSAILGNTWVMSTAAPVQAPRTLQVAPLVYAGGWSVLPTLLRGGTNVLMSRFDAEETLETIRTQSIDWMFAVPTMLRRLSQSHDVAALRGAKLGCLMLAGEPAAIPALEIVSEHTDALIQCWGQTEAPASTTYLSRGEMGDPALWPSIGRPVPGVEFSLYVDGQIVNDLAPGVEGELAIRTPSVAVQLLGAEEERDRRLLDEGWWRTSDLARFDAEGRIYLLGRTSETIITGGTNIQPVEIERALEAHPGVVEAVVVGVPDDRWGETPAAFVQVRALPTGPPDLWDWVRRELSGYKRPRYLFTSTAPLPRASGESKIARGELKRALASWTEGRVQIPDGVTKVEEANG